MGVFKNLFFKNEVNLNDQSIEIDDVLLSALLNGETITKEKALTLPAVSDDVDFISSMIACMPVKLYRYKKDQVQEVKGDIRTRLLNGDTGDTVNAFNMKKNMVRDYLLDIGGYTVVERNFNEVIGLYYVEPIYVSPYVNANPIKKYVNFLISDKVYKKHEVITLLRNTTDGAWGKSLIKEVSKAIETAYTTLIYELGLVKSGGNKKGFLQSEYRLEQEQIDKLKKAWNKLYQTNENNCIVLNKGIKFQEASNSSVEMQLNENKRTLNDEIHEIFHISKDFYETFKKAIYPIVKAYETELNSTLLLEDEKKNYFFEFDVKEILRAVPKERMEALKMAKEIGLKTINEMRKEENLNYVEGMDVIPFSLGSVLYDVNTGTYFTPNKGEVNDGKGNTNQPEEEQSKENMEGGEEQ